MLRLPTARAFLPYRLRAISSILKIILTVSAANSTALVLTSSGCNTFSSFMLFLTPPLRMLTPAPFSPNSCRCLRSVTTLMLFKPAFSANVVGTISMASANAFQQMASVPLSSRACLVKEVEMAISGAPPPAMSARFFTRHRITQSASWRERSASSRIRLLAPRTRTETVLPASLCVMPVNFTMRAPDVWASSRSSALPSLSSVKDSMSAMGLQPVDCLKTRFRLTIDF